MKKLLAIGAATAICLSSGAASAASSATINDTGKNSTNKIKIYQKNKQDVENCNDVNVNNTNGQGASSGSANVSNNKHGGDAESGDASNSNRSNTDVSLTNSTSWGLGQGGNFDARISDTGKNSDNTIRYTSINKQTVSNNNKVNVNNSNSQSASSGSANVSNNKHAGDATSGDASNHNSTSTNVHVNNTVN